MVVRLFNGFVQSIGIRELEENSEDLRGIIQGSAPLCRSFLSATAISKRKASNSPPSPVRNSTYKQPYFAIMALYQREPYPTADRSKVAANESDEEENALVEDYKEQVHFDDDMGELDRTASFGTSGGPHDMQAQLTAAATPLEYGAALDTKFASYDNYCNLFHYILNSEGPVDLEVPTVSTAPLFLISQTANGMF